LGLVRPLPRTSRLPKKYENDNDQDDASHARSPQNR